jgi:hypothetical protein
MFHRKDETPIRTWASSHRIRSRCSQRLHNRIGGHSLTRSPRIAASVFGAPSITPFLVDVVGFCRAPNACGVANHVDDVERRTRKFTPASR